MELQVNRQEAQLLYEQLSDFLMKSTEEQIMLYLAKEEAKRDQIQQVAKAIKRRFDYSAILTIDVTGELTPLLAPVANQPTERRQIILDVMTEVKRLDPDIKGICHTENFSSENGKCHINFIFDWKC